MYSLQVILLNSMARQARCTGLSNDADGFGYGDDLRIDFFLPVLQELEFSWNGSSVVLSVH